MSPQQQKKPVQSPQSGWVACANIAKVFNLIVPVLMSIILTITIIVLAVQKNTKNIKFLATLLGIFIFVILVVIWLSNHFPMVMCVLFLLNILFIIFSIILLSKK